MQSWAGQFRVKNQPRISVNTLLLNRRKIHRLKGAVFYICDPSPWRITLQEINISHLGKRKIIFKYALSGGYVNSLEVFCHRIVGFTGNIFSSRKEKHKYQKTSKNKNTKSLPQLQVGLPESVLVIALLSWKFVESNGQPQNCITLPKTDIDTQNDALENVKHLLGIYDNLWPILGVKDFIHPDGESLAHRVTALHKK